VAWAAADLDSTPGQVILAIGCSRAEYGLCEQIPGCNFSKKDSLWRVPLTWPAWVCFRTIWAQQHIVISPALQEFERQEWEVIKDRYRWRSVLSETDQGIALHLDELDEHSPGFALLPFQRGGAQWLDLAGRAILEDPQGNGKTPQVIRALQMQRHHAGRVGWQALVIATPAACRNWKREFARWAPEMDVQVVSGTATARRKALAAGDASVYVLPWPDVRLHTRLANYPGQAFVRCDAHGGSTGKTPAQCEVHPKELNAMTFDVVVADEAHRMKDARSKQTRAAWYLAHSARCFWPVTGTPVADHVGDVWPVLHGISEVAFPSKSRYLDLFARKEYAWHGGTEILGLRPDNEQAFHAIVQPYVRRIPKEIGRAQLGSVYKGRLEPAFRYPEMAPAQRKSYDQMRKVALAELESTTVVPENTIVAFTRLCQMAASAIEAYDGEDRDGFTTQRIRMVAPSHKAADLLDFLADEDESEQFVVYMNSPQLLAICEAKLADAKIKYDKVAGGMAEWQQDESVQSFQRGDSRVCLITRAGMESITLTAASTILFLQPNPSFLQTDQAIGRIDRIGQEYPVRVIYSLTPNTVEERLFQLSQEKQERADEVTRDADLMRWMLTP
jgi:SNF2 family DNA or RNA helicase